MRGKLRKILLSVSVLVFAAVLWCGIGLEVQAAELVQSGQCGDALTWTLNDAGTLTISGSGAMPDWSGAYDAAEVPWSAYRDQIVHVVIEEGVTNIGASAFYMCEQMETIQIPDSVTSIGDDSFWHCSALQKVTIPDSVSELGSFIFNACSSLKELDIGNGVQSMGMYTVYDCENLTVVRIGSGLKQLNSVSFYGCENVQQVHITDLRAWAQVECDDSRGTPMQRGVKLYLNGQLLTKVEIPEGTTHIGGHAFYGCSNITEIVIPDSVTTIGDGAFMCMEQLKSIQIGSGLTQTAESAFRDCPALTDVTFSDHCAAHIDRYAFMDCISLNNVYTGGVTRFEDSAFNGCSALESITFGPGLQKLDDEIFVNCGNLREMIFTGDEPSIGYEAFVDLTDVLAYYPQAWERGGTSGGGEVIWIPYTDHIHTWDEGKITAEGTCSQYGAYTYTCAQCTTTYSELLPMDEQKHNPYEDWILNNNWHSRKCQDCSTVLDVGSHTPGSNATETTPQLCTVCQMVLTPATGHVHKGNQWSASPEQHWKECTCGKALQLGDHIYTTYCDNTCNTCGYISDVDHTWSSGGTCLYCGKENPDYVPPVKPDPIEPSVPAPTGPTTPEPTTPKPTSPTAPVPTQPVNQPDPQPTQPVQPQDQGLAVWHIVIIVVVGVLLAGLTVVAVFVYKKNQ